MGPSATTDTTCMNLLRTAFILWLAAGSAACIGPLKDLFDSPTEPTTDPAAVRSYLGTWMGPTVTAFPTTQSCANMQWKITSQTGSQMAGDFQASCSGGIALAGAIAATHGDTIPWGASGTATQGSTNCPFNMTGTGTFQGTSNILVNYAGTTCMGPLSGSETITR
jgi:hypothetical protein